MRIRIQGVKNLWIRIQVFILTKIFCLFTPKSKKRSLSQDQNADPDPDPGTQDIADPDPDPGTPKRQIQCESGS